MKQEEIEYLKTIFCNNRFGDKTKFIIFGSQALGSEKKFSDLDIGILGENITSEQYFEILEDLDNSRLPYTVDLVKFSDVSEEFKKIALLKTIPLN